MGDEAAATVTPATSAEIASSSVDDDDDAILAELDKEFGAKDNDDEGESKPAKPKDKEPASKPKKPEPKDDDEDEDDEPEKPAKKPAKKDESNDEDDEDEDDDDPKDRKRPRLDPKTPADVKKFFNEKWREYRLETESRDKAHRADVATLAQERADFQTWIKDTVAPKLQPAIRVMKAMDAFAKGDVGALREVIEAGTGQPLDKGTKMLVQGTKTSAAEQRLNAKIADLEKKLETKESQETEQQTAARREAAVTKHLENLTEELEGHPVTKLKGFEKKVFAVQRKSYDPKLKAFKLSPEEAANKVVRIEKRRLAELRALDEDEPTKPAATKPKAEGARVFALNRGDSSESGALPDDESDEDILKDLDRQFARKRREEAKAKGKR